MWGSAGEESFVTVVFEGSVSPRRRRRSPRVCVAVGRSAWSRSCCPPRYLVIFCGRGCLRAPQGSEESAPSIPGIVLPVSHNGMNGLISCTAFVLFFIFSLVYFDVSQSCVSMKTFLPAQSFGERMMSFFVTFARFNGFLQSSALLFFFLCNVFF